METTVTTPERTVGEGEYALYVPSQTVHNVGLIDRRRSHLMLAGLLTLVGVLLLGFSTVGESVETAKDLKPCPFCAELIRQAAIKCRHCNGELPEAFRKSPPPKVRQIATRQLKTSEVETMEAFGISYVDGRFRFGEYEYEGLAEAVIHAKAALKT